MAIYFIDYENVHEGGLQGLDQLREEDTVCLLYSNAAQSLTIDTMAMLTASRVKIQYFKCLNSGKNYLDFQLATVCGMMAGTSRDTEFVIVSGDKGFNSLVDFWNGQEYFQKQFSCRLQGTIAKETKTGKAKPKKRTAPVKKDMVQPVRELTPVKKDAVQPVKEPIPVKKDAVQPVKESIPVKQETAQTARESVTTKPQPKKQGTLQKAGILNISDALKKRIRPAVKALELKPSEYTTIYQSCLKATAESDLKNRLMQGLGKEQGIKTFESILPIYQSILQKIAK